MKKLISMLMVVLMLLPLVPVNASYEPQFEYEAQMLKEMGLFRGTENGFDLDKKCDRLQAAALFIRLLGKEEEAITNPKEHPFTDVPEWASPYVGQMYYDGYTKGISETEYGIGDVDATQFATFCLRALGYQDVANFKGTYYAYFNYEDALEKMLKEYILRKENYDIIKNSNVFLRDHAVKMAYNTLFDEGLVDGTRAKEFLIRRLAETGVLPYNFLESNHIFIEDNMLYLYSKDSFIPYYENMIREAAEENKDVSVVLKYEFDYNHDFSIFNTSLIDQELFFTEAGDEVPVNIYDLNSETLKHGEEYMYYSVEITPSNPILAKNYRCARYITHGDVELTNEESKIVNEVKKFLATINENMSDYDKYKAAYDYLADNIEYDYAAADYQKGKGYYDYDKYIRANSISGIIDGKAICAGYANLYMYFCRLMGLECWFIGGTVYGGANDEGESHAWNKVKLDGKYYNVDATWNNNGYEYFLFKDKTERIADDFSKACDFPANEDYKN